MRGRRRIAPIAIAAMLMFVVGASDVAIGGKKKKKPTRKQWLANTLYLAATHGELETVRKMLEDGVDPNHPNQFENVPLFGATRAGNSEAVRLLLNAGADVNYVKASDGWTALHSVARYGHDLDTLRLLLDAGADRHATTTTGWDPLQTAARHHGEVEFIRLLLGPERDRVAPTARDDGWTALHSLARYTGDPAGVALLLDQGWRIDEPTGAGITPLMLASYRGATDVVQLLLDRGADVEATGHKGETALAWALEKDHPETASILGTALRRERLARVLERDAALPLDVRRDKYMIALTSRLKEERFDDALLYFDLLDSLDVEISPALDFYHGEALLRTDQPARAIEKLYAYIAETGSGGEHYARALELVNEAEQQLGG